MRNEQSGLTSLLAVLLSSWSTISCATAGSGTGLGSRDMGIGEAAVIELLNNPDFAMAIGTLCGIAYLPSGTIEINLCAAPSPVPAPEPVDGHVPARASPIRSDLELPEYDHSSLEALEEQDGRQLDAIETEFQHVLLQKMGPAYVRKGNQLVRISGPPKLTRDMLYRLADSYPAVFMRSGVPLLSWPRGEDREAETLAAVSAHATMRFEQMKPTSQVSTAVPSVAQSAPDWIIVVGVKAHGDEEVIAAVEPGLTPKPVVNAYAVGVWQPVHRYFLLVSTKHGEAGWEKSPTIRSALKILGGMIKIVRVVN